MAGPVRIAPTFTATRPHGLRSAVHADALIRTKRGDDVPGQISQMR